jgi:sec-independent protein translocase protein TatA
MVVAMKSCLVLAFGMPAAPEWIVIGILALILLGPRKLPDLARGLGKALGEIQKAKEDFQREIRGVPPLPKIESAGGVPSTASGSNGKLESGVTESEGDTVRKENPALSGDLKA